ncbi:MAG: hypothetical protein MRERV_16c018 [Mycoplasmataceae bacterium RV_VA103A]|nr:MAG: hypothetical protein MRERV_16c018 [Mycoplasmataceae bacterium RV_VA103A]
MEDKKKRMRMANQRGGYVAEKPNKKPVKSASSQKEKAFEKYLQKIEDPNYQGGSWDLSENPTALEKTKYDLCEIILAHKQDNKLTTKNLAQKIKLSVAETEDILYYRIDHFTLDRLMDYAGKLFDPKQVRVSIIEKPKKNGNRLYA